MQRYLLILLDNKSVCFQYCTLYKNKQDVYNLVVLRHERNLVNLNNFGWKLYRDNKKISIETSQPLVHTKLAIKIELLDVVWCESKVNQHFFPVQGCETRG